MSDVAVRRNILLGVTGSIAACKAADLASQLSQAGHSVTVIMTAGAVQFVTPLTFRTLTRNPVITSLWDEVDSGRPGHIELADSADLLIIAPATASTIARLAHGLADDSLSAIALATRAPLLIAPAMNGKMWDHPATRANTSLLLARGAQLIGPDHGMLACGYEGPGRLHPVDGIVRRAMEMLANLPPEGN